MSKYGKKYICIDCACVFYDLNKSQPECPRCSTIQNAVNNSRDFDNLGFVKAKKPRKTRVKKVELHSEFQIFNIPGELD
ncbi:MAG: FYDLN acid domain-containing protein [Pseudomonadota bacterium]